MNSKVYFTRAITPEKVVELYHALGVQLPGKVAVKVHSGEKGNQNFLRPEFWRPMVEEVHGTVVECNTAYGDATTGVRDNTESHRKLLEEHADSILGEYIRSMRKKEPGVCTAKALEYGVNALLGYDC